MNRHAKRARSWTFTLNNWKTEDETTLKELATRYIIYGKEVAPETGTPHIQGYFVFDNSKKLSQLKAQLGSRYHFEVAKGTAEQNRVYCSKDGDIYEAGTIPLTPKQCGENEKARWETAWQLAKEGRIEEIDPSIRLRYLRTLRMVKPLYGSVPVTTDGLLTHEWICGRSGIGKSKRARDENPGAYIKDKDKWWDGYNGESAVIVDDIDKYDVKMSYNLKMWGDRYPFQAETKGGMSLIRPSKVVITSQYHYRDIWSNDEITLDALERRYKVCCLSKYNSQLRIFE